MYEIQDCLQFYPSFQLGAALLLATDHRATGGFIPQLDKAQLDLTLLSGERISSKRSVEQKVFQAFQAAFFILDLEFQRFSLCLEVGYRLNLLVLGRGMH